MRSGLSVVRAAESASPTQSETICTSRLSILPGLTCTNVEALCPSSRRTSAVPCSERACSQCSSPRRALHTLSSNARSRGQGKCPERDSSPSQRTYATRPRVRRGATPATASAAGRGEIARGGDAGSTAIAAEVVLVSASLATPESRSMRCASVGVAACCIAARLRGRSAIAVSLVGAAGRVASSRDGPLRGPSHSCVVLTPRPSAVSAITMTDNQPGRSLFGSVSSTRACRDTRGA